MKNIPLSYKTVLLPAFLLVFQTVFGQNVGISSAAIVPDISSMLEVQATNKGILIPRIALTGINDALTIATPATSLMVYCTGTGGLTPAGYYYNSSTTVAPVWKRFATGSGDAWQLLGNAGTVAGTNFIGTTDAVDWVIKTNNTERMRILSNGKVGIATPTVTNTDVQLNGTPTNSADYSALRILKSGNTANLYDRGISVEITPAVAYPRMRGIYVDMGTVNTDGDQYAFYGTQSKNASQVFTVISELSRQDSYSTYAYGAAVLGTASGTSWAFAGTNDNSLSSGDFTTSFTGTPGTDATYKMIMAGTKTSLYGTITSPAVPATFIAAALYANDAATGTATHWAGYFSGNSYFSGKVGVGTPTLWSTLDSYKSGSDATFTNIVSDGTNNAITIVTHSTGGDVHFPGIVWCDEVNWGVKTKAAIWPKYTAGGSYLNFGTTNNYTSGVNNIAITIDPSGNTGIGTTTPAQKLDVAGTAQMTGFKLPTGATNGYVLTSDATGTGTWQAASGGGGYWTLSGNNLYPTTISNNVGIGTTTPITALDVRSAGSGLDPAQLQLYLVDTRAFATGVGGGVGFVGNYAAGSLAGFSSIWGAKENATSGDYASYLGFATRINGGGVTERMRISSGGNVGIGATVPGQKLDVAGNITVEGNYLTGSSYNQDMIRIANDANWTFGCYNSVPDYWMQATYSETGDNHRGFRVFNRPAGETVFSTNKTYSYFQYGKVGIGLTVPSYLLDVYSGNVNDPNAGLRVAAGNTASNIALSVGSWNSVKFTILANGTVYSTGNVGIGTAAPGGLLELSLDQGRKPATNTWTIVSDERLKNIEGPYKKGLKEILQLQPITYRYKNVGERKFSSEVLATLNVGFSAQNVQKIFPEAVGTDTDGYLNFNMHSILVAYVNAIKEQQQMIDSLKFQVQSLKSEQVKQQTINDKQQTQLTIQQKEIETIKEQLGMEAKK